MDDFLEARAWAKSTDEARPMTRDYLHALVWSQPMRTVAKSMGISDVALAKKCRAANVPVLPRGWWAKKAAGQPVKVHPLPNVPFVFRNYFPALEPDAGLPDSADGPTKPVFRNLVAVKEEIEEAVGNAKTPKSLSQPHPIIARLLEQDEGRKKDQRSSGLFSEYFGPKFVSEIQQRRLRFLCGLFAELERLGCKIRGSTHAGERFSVQFGSRWAYMSCRVETEPPQRALQQPRPRDQYLRFDLTDHDADGASAKRSWTEKESKFDAQIREIVRGLLFSVEEQTRATALASYEWSVQLKAQREREAALATKKAEEERVARLQAAKDAQIAALTQGADALETAERIRRYVATANQKYAAIRPDEARRWVEWALAIADDLDPLVSGKFLSDLSGH